MNNATSKFRAWDHYLRVQRYFRGRGGGWRRRMIVARKRVENWCEVSRRRRTRTSHPLASNATKFPYLGLTYTLARPFPRFFHPLSLSRNHGGQASYINHERLTRDSREEGLSLSPWWNVANLGDVYSTVLYFKGWNGGRDGRRRCRGTRILRVASWKFCLPDRERKLVESSRGLIKGVTSVLAR